MHLLLIGTSHHTAPLAFREALAFTESEAAAAIGELAQEPELEELLLLSTCNRTELLVRHNLRPRPAAALPVRLARQFCEHKNVKAPDPAYFYVRQDLDAARHVFRVAAGLDSMVVGEPQIFGQLKDAYRLAYRCGTDGFLLNKLMHTAFRVGKRARTETEIGTGAVSVGRVAAELISEITGRPQDHRALIVGAGEMARLLGLHLYKTGYRKLTVCNRTARRAAVLAEALHGDWCRFELLPEALAECDVLVTAINAAEPIITGERLADRRGRPLYILDVGVPRNVAHDVERLDGVQVHNINALQDTVAASYDRRRDEIPRVEQIIEEELEAFQRWQRTLTVKPTTIELLEKYEQIRRDEVERSAGNLPADVREELEIMSKRLVNKILHAPIRHLKDTQHQDLDNSEFWVETIRKVFDLEGDEK